MIASLAVSNYFWLCITIINLSIHPFFNRMKDIQPLLNELLVGTHAPTLASHGVWSIMTLSPFDMSFIPGARQAVGFTSKMSPSHRLCEAWF